MSKFKKVILVYHSISGYACNSIKGSFPITMERFTKQINSLRQQGWSFEFLSNLNAEIQNNTIYITGDDGTIDWAKNILPWCEKEKIPTHTGIITGPWLENPIFPITHRVQIALMINNKQFNLDNLTDDEKNYIDKIYHYETDNTRRYVKGCCNLLYDFNKSSNVLGNYTFEEITELSQRFANYSEYQKYKYCEVGVHTVSHRAFDGNVNNYIETEIIPCLSMLLRHNLKLSKFFTLPMRPMFGAKVEQLVEPLKNLGFEGILDGPGEWDQTSFIIPRIDAKDVETFFNL